MDHVFVDVVVEIPAVWDRVFTYSHPACLSLPYGAKVHVPFGNSSCDAYVVGARPDPPAVDVKNIAWVYDPAFLPPRELLNLGLEIARLYVSPISLAWSCLWPPVAPRKKVSDLVSQPDLLRQYCASWRHDQATGYGSPGYGSPGHGSSGYGSETEVDVGQGQPEVSVAWGRDSFRWDFYLDQIKSVAASGSGVIVLVPEVKMVEKAAAKLTDVLGEKVVSWHSEMTGLSRRNSWSLVSTGRKTVVVGTRSAIFAPVKPLGLIVVEGEDSESYKSPETPCYDARTVAVMRARIQGCPVIFGSLHPSVSTYRQVESGRYAVVRDAGISPPRLRTVDMKKKPERMSWLSDEARTALESSLASGGRALIFVNRRGDSTWLSCHDCGRTVLCRRCSVPLAYHSRGPEGPYLLCHVCGTREKAPETCQYCGGSKWKFSGYGTERVENWVRRDFGVEVFRLDQDVAEVADPESLVRRFEESSASCLVATQMATGFDLPSLDLVIVLSLDSCLAFPDFRAAERCFHLLWSLAGYLVERDNGGGRASPSPAAPTMVVQTYNPHHRALMGLMSQEAFYRAELDDREALGYPPFGELFRIVFSGKNQTRVMDSAQAFAAACLQHGSDLDVLGPAPSPRLRERGNYRWQVVLRGKDRSAMIRLCRTVLEEVPRASGVKVVVDPDPVDMR